MHYMLIIKYSWFLKIVFLDLLLKIPGSIGAIRSLARAGQFKAHFKRLFLRRIAEFNSALELNATPQKKRKKKSADIRHLKQTLVLRSCRVEI